MLKVHLQRAILKNWICGVTYCKSKLAVSDFSQKRICSRLSQFPAGHFGKIWFAVGLTSEYAVKLSVEPPLLLILELSLLLLLLPTPRVKCLLSMSPWGKVRTAANWAFGRETENWRDPQQRGEGEGRSENYSDHPAGKALGLSSYRAVKYHEYYAHRPLSVSYTESFWVCEMTTWWR